MATLYSRSAKIMGENVKHISKFPPRKPRTNSAYLSIANTPSTKCEDPQRQLIILDLNGALVSKTGKNGMWVRPHSNEFLKYLFSEFTVGVWSSARPETVDKMCQLFGDFKTQLLFMWNRENFGLSIEDYHRKLSTVKDLQLVWRNLETDQNMPTYTARNTILLDDSASKAILQPYNNIEISEFNHKSDDMKQKGDNELLNVIEYLEKLKYEDNVSNYMKEYPYTRTLQPDTANMDDFKSTHFRYSDNNQTTGDLRNIAGLGDDRWQKKRPRKRDQLRHFKSKNTASQ
jgi:hypothetical protein